MKILAICLLFVFATLAHAAPSSKIASPDPNNATAARFLPGSDFEVGMTFADVEAVILRKYRDWHKTEGRQAISTHSTKGVAGGDYVNSIKLESPRRPDGAPLSDIYKLHFTSPLSGSTLYGITRDVRFPHLPKDRIAYDAWTKTLSAHWGEPYAVKGPNEDDIVRAFFFFDNAGVAASHQDNQPCTAMFRKIHAITQDAADNIEAVIGEMERERCHFLIEASAIFGKNALLVQTLSRSTDLHAYLRDMLARKSYKGQ
ncbi:hypothetical protein I6F15_12015 [Bradyrhizobium sp. BRP14]|nr:hypothetical protein [Bradyrhizobium sp. BRP14]